MLYFQDVARDVVNSVRSDVVSVMNAVQQLQRSRMDAESLRADGDAK